VRTTASGTDHTPAIGGGSRHRFCEDERDQAGCERGRFEFGQGRLQDRHQDAILNLRFQFRFIAFYIECMAIFSNKTFDSVVFDCYALISRYSNRQRRCFARVWE
jgi:hypothetical protein